MPTRSFKFRLVVVGRPGSGRAESSDWTVHVTAFRSAEGPRRKGAMSDLLNGVSRQLKGDERRSLEDVGAGLSFC